MGPITIFDKSALQALSMDESVWFDAFLSGNIVPLFYVETLADLEKDVGEEGDPKELVGMLADKTPSHAFPNASHRKLVLAEVAGAEIEMTGRPVVDAGNLKRTKDGSVGLHVDEFPEQAALLRWRDHDFLELERDVAKGWRAELRRGGPLPLDRHG